MADPTPTPSPPKIPWFNLAAVGLLAVLIIGSAVWQKLPTPPQPIPPAPLPEPDKNKPVIIPEKVQVDVGDWADVTAKSLGPVMWLVPPPLSKSAKVNENTLTFLGRKEGEYWVGANTVLEGKETVPVWVMVTVGKPKPNPPGPDPTPPKPEPTDSIWPALKLAWLADGSATKQADRDKLASLYGEATGYASDKTIKTGKELNDILSKARLGLIDDRLASVRAVLNAENDRILPTVIDQPLDQEKRDLCAKTFARYSDLLKRLP